MKLGIRESIDKIRTFSRTFVERPRFAMVIAIVLTMAGVMSITWLPISQYPRLTPPSISVTYNYPGANAKEILNTVAMPIEDEVNGVDDMLYMVGSCSDTGTYNLNVSFEVESDRDMDMVKVQNRVAQAEAKLPSEVKQLGGRIRAQAEDMLGVVTLRSPKGTLSRLQISDYIYGNIQPVMLRIPGVGEATVYGPRLSMRVWMDPDRMAAQGLNSEEVIAALSKQNVQASVGSVGASPIPSHGAKVFTLTAKGRLMTPKEFNEIVVRRDANGGLVKLKDIARTEVGEENYMFTGQFNGGNAVSMALQQKPGANAIATMDQIYKEMKRLQQSFPDDLEWIVPYDATDYVRMCVKEIVMTLGITFGLVVLVCYLFLQDWRATLIPCLTIPVSLCSTFILMAILGYSINILTLFGLVLAIGVVVDDCIVVVERVQFLIETRGLNAKEAAIQAMSDVTSAVIATTLVLLGIFVPVGFMSGITGRIYQQFSVTLSAAVCFSTVCALTLAPALCSLILREARPYKHGPLAWFNWCVERFKGLFVTAAKWLASRIFLAGVLLLLVILLTVSAFLKTQTAFLPDEDQRVVFASMEMPEGTARDRSRDTALRAVEMLRQMPEVSSVLSITGWGMIGGRGENQTTLIIDLKGWDQRPLPEQHALALIGKIQAMLAAIPEPKWQVFVPPAIPGLGVANGISVHIQDKVDSDPMKIDEIKKKLLMKLNQNPHILMAFAGYNAETPHLKFNLDRIKSAGGDDLRDAPELPRLALRERREPRHAGEPRDRVRRGVGPRHARGRGAALRAVGHRGDGARGLARHDHARAWPAHDLHARQVRDGRPHHPAAAGRAVRPRDERDTRTSQGRAAVSFQEARNEGTAAPLILLAVLFGYLFLVAQYESWTIPLPVMLSIFVAVFGALLGLKYWGIFATGKPFALSIYAQLGLVLLVGLASKNAILLVEFAKDKHENDGYSIVDAAGAAAGERLRALLMTALTTLLGTLPMMIATGAGAASRNHLGTTEFFGMLASVVFGILLIPGLYALFQTWRERIKRFFGYLSAMARRRRDLKARG